MQNIDRLDVEQISDKLPTNLDVLSGIRFLIGEKPKYHKKASTQYHTIADHILFLWRKTNIPTLEKASVIRLMQKRCEEYKAEVKRMQRNVAKKSENMLTLTKLFDISKCKCFRDIDSETFNESSSKCKCALRDKIPSFAFPFYLDQKSARRLFLNYFDEYERSLNESVVTGISEVSLTNNLKSSDEVDHYCEDNAAAHLHSNAEIFSISSAEAYDNDDPDYEPWNDDSATNNAFNLKKLDLRDVIQICDAKLVSGKASAAIVTATLSAATTSQEDKSAAVVISQQTFQNQTNRLRKQLLAENNEKVSGMSSFQFDGKKCDTMIRKNRKGNTTAKVEYYVIVKQPGDEFVAALKVDSGGSQEIFEKFRTHFESKHISLDNLVALSSDGAPVNVGVDNGVIRRFEQYLKRPLQWVICLYHLNELVFHRLLGFLDPSSCSPDDYSSAFGKQLKNCEKFPVKKFPPIKLDKECLPNNFEKWNLSHDQKFLMNMALALDSGKLSSKLANTKPGRMNKARWVTTMSRALRVYVTYEKPPRGIIQILATYVMKIYIPVLLAIKSKDSFIHGSRHLHMLISLCELHFNKPIYKDVYKELVDVITNNSYFAHHENILLAMATDDDNKIRRQAYEMILYNIRLTNTNNIPDSQNVRKFKKPANLNFDCKHYSQMIALDRDEITVPPVMNRMSIDDLEFYKDSDRIKRFEEIPSHTQAVERYIQITAAHAKRTPNLELQQGAIINTATYRKNMRSKQKE